MIDWTPDYRIVVTGGSGFIGSHLCLSLVQNGATVLNVDKHTYAANPAALSSIVNHERYHFIKADICDAPLMSQIFDDFQPTSVFHLAAETHVDRSIASGGEFIETNIYGTFSLLEAAKRYLSGSGQPHPFLFHHVSTDEVYGDLELNCSPFIETTSYRPSSPYSASKAASDHLAMAWCRTYGLPVLITNCSNNYGPNQHREKLIPLMISNAIAGRALPIYGDGKNVRDWLYVQDHVDALQLLHRKGKVGETYNIGGNCEQSNIQVVREICRLLDKLAPSANGKSYSRNIKFVPDRPGHDLRYAIDFSKLRRGLGWSPRYSFEKGLILTIEAMLECN